MSKLSSALDVRLDWLICGETERKTDQPTAFAVERKQSPRDHIESRLLQLSKNLPMSFLATIIGMMESVVGYLE
ncbi:hypothetical protein MO327_18770 [Xanthomonas translucens]|nr:hypothetical protein [Xanthomonas translucens]WLA14336.1 hypothetical protein MO327_18770 [Xanthomonas translucens]